LGRIQGVRRSGAALLLALISMGSQSQVYSWTDENGVMYFSDRPPAAGAPQPHPKAQALGASPAAVAKSPSFMPASQPVRVDIDVQNSFRFYPVHGDSAFAVQRYIDRFGPVDTNGKRAPGKGIYAFDWRVTPKGQGRGCAVAQVEVAVNIQQILPKWAELSGAETHWQLWWQAYLDQMARYEQRQHDLIKGGAEQIAARLKQLDAAADCKALQVQVAELGLHELGKLRRRSEQLATATDNGKRLPN